MIDPQYLQIADWMKALIGAVVGYVAAITTDVIKTRINERHKRQGMRKALAAELATIWGLFGPILEVPNPTPEQADQLLKFLTGVSVDAYKLAKAQPEVFYGMKEASKIDQLYLPVTIIKSFCFLPGTASVALVEAQKFHKALAEVMATTKSILGEPVNIPLKDEKSVATTQKA